jgi:hypothetical protein
VELTCDGGVDAGNQPGYKETYRQLDNRCGLCVEGKGRKVIVLAGGGRVDVGNQPGHEETDHDTISRGIQTLFNVLAGGRF